MIFRITVVKLIRITFTRLIAAFGKPYTHRIPCLLKLGNINLEMTNGKFTCRNHHLTNLALHLDILVHNKTNTLSHLLNRSDRRIIVINRRSMRIRFNQTAWSCKLEQLLVRLVHITKIARMSAIDSLHLRHLLNNNIHFHKIYLFKIYGTKFVILPHMDFTILAQRLTILAIINTVYRYQGLLHLTKLSSAHSKASFKRTCKQSHTTKTTVESNVLNRFP